MRKSILMLAALAWPGTAFAQSVPLQAGPWTPGHMPMYSVSGQSQPVVQDSGTSGGGAAGANLSELGITSRSGNGDTTAPYASNGNGPLATHFCMYDAPITNATGYHYLCMDPNSQSGGLIAYGAAGGATVQPLNINVNGVEFPLVPGGGGTSSFPSLVPVDVIADSPLNGLYGTYFGAQIEMCPGYDYGCPGKGHILAQLAQIGTTGGAADSQETGIYSYLISNNGYAAIWTGSTAYVVDSFAKNGANLYKQTAAVCISAVSGGPTGTGTNIVDGTCRWDYSGPQYLNAKQNIGFINKMEPGGGNGWGIAGGVFAQPGWNSQFATAVEFDAVNYSGTDADGSAMTIYNIYLGGNTGTNPITALMYMSPDPSGTNFGAHYGIWINGPYATKDADIRVSTAHSNVGFYNDGNHVTATFLDSSTTPVGLSLTGHYATSAIFIPAGTASTAISVGGSQRLCLNGFSACMSGGASGVVISSQTLVDGDFYVTGQTGNGSIFLRNQGASQSYSLSTAAGASGSWLFRDVTASKNPLVIQANALNNNVTLTATGVTFAGTITSGVSVGVTCSGAPTGSFASTNGIVTHC